MKRTILIVSLAIFYCIDNYAQIDKHIEPKIDKVFDTYVDKTKPGVAAGLIKDGKIIYLKGYGCANKETGELITTNTRFQLGELSKQFTSLAILLLVEEGKIALSDDIRKYLTELPEYNHVVRIRHLLNHSSGLYDINRISNLVNGTMNVTSQSEALKLITAQRQLVFEPGTDFSFHEAVTESVLMAEIVARVTDQTFAEFVREQIFKPLGMNNSVIKDNANTLLSKVAQPYQAIEGSNMYNRNEVNSSVVGAINAYSTAEDLAKWYLNYSSPQGKVGQLIQKLDTPVKLDDGNVFEYYWGKMAVGREFAHPERGLPIFWNYGMQGAYGTNVFRYLDQKIIAFVLGNNNQYNGGLAHDMVDVFVEDLYPLPANIDFESKNIKNLRTLELEKYVGNYWFDEGYASQIFVENDTLRSKWLFSSRSQTLVPLSDNTFQQYAKMEDTRLFRFEDEGEGMTLYFTYNESTPDIMKRYEPVKLSTNDLQWYEGAYYNSEYGSIFTFNIEDGELVVKNIKHRDIKLMPVMRDVFTSTSMFFNAITFIRDDSNMVKGFKIVTDGVHDLTFKKAL